MTIVAGFSLGLGFLVPLIVGILLTGSSSSIAKAGGPDYLTSLTGYNPISPAVSTELKSLTGWTQTSTGSVGWYLGALGQILGIATTSYAVTEVLSAFHTGYVPALTSVVAAAMGIIAIMVAGVSYSLSSIGGAVVSLFFDAASVILDGLAISKEGLTLANGLVIAMDAGTVAITLATA
jgi:hypothetical protein